VAIHLSKHKLTYISVPKVACTSLKHFFFEVENGFAFKPFRLNGKRYGIHNFTQSRKFSMIKPKKMAGHRKITVVRDPWRRILSCYASKVVSGKTLHDVEFTQEQKKLGLVFDPSLDNFVDLLEHYCAASPVIRRHAQPLSHFLGKDPDFYDRIFSISQLPQMIEYVGTIVPAPPALRHLNKKTSDKIDISQADVERNRPLIEAAYAEDLEVFGTFM
jgi:hypothetical protein